MATRVKVHSVNSTIEYGWIATLTVYEDVDSVPTAMGDFTEKPMPIVGAITWANISEQAYNYAVKAAASRASGFTENLNTLYP